MSNIKSLRIKDSESRLIKMWLHDNAENMKEEMTETELLHQLIYIGLSKTKICSKGFLIIR
jgi:hypothetical protein